MTSPSVKTQHNTPLFRHKRSALTRYAWALWMVIAIVSLPNTLFTQDFGGVPPGKEWRIKGNDLTKVIYDQDVSNIADTVLSILDWINKKDPYSLGKLRENIHIILRNENLTSNGFVGYVPFRSEFYIHGSQNPNTIGYSDWIRLLSVHEYRHVIQYSNINRGIPRLAGNIFGDAALAGIYNLLVPDWFAEGDAVFFESIVTGTGRAQLPAFTAGFRALLMEDIKYGYPKYRNGSLKDLVPDHYVHGYMLTSFSYHNYPDSFWPDVLKQTSLLKGFFVPFSKAIRRNSGLKLREFHNTMMDDYQKYLFNHLDTSLQKDPFLLPPSDKIKNELQILVDSSGQKYLLENSFDDIHAVYKLNGIEKEKLFSLGRTFDPYIILRDSKIFFTNRNLDPRWTNREYADIYYYDIPTDKIHRVTHRKKYLSVDFHPDSQRFLAVQAGKNGVSTVVTFQKNDESVDTLLHDPGTYYSYPRWLHTGSEQFVFTGRKNGRMYLGLHNLSTGETKKLIPDTREAISRPFVGTDGIYLSSSRSGIDNIYYYDLHTQLVIPVTFNQIGAYNPTAIHRAISGKTEVELYYSTKTAFGQRIQVRDLETTTSILRGIRTVPELEPKYVERLPQGMSIGMRPLDPIQSVSKKYLPFHHLFHFHSLYLEPSATTPKLSWLSNDYLNTTRAGIYGQYFNSDRSYEFGGEITYAGWYPELSFNANHRMNRSLSVLIDDDIFQLPKTETSAEVGLAIPLDFSHRQVSHFLHLHGQYGWTQEHFDPEDPILPERIGIEPRLFRTGIFNTDWSIFRLKAYRDIFPKWGMATTLTAKRSFSPGESWLLYGSQAYYIPGFFRNDGFKFKWQIQRNSSMAHNFLSYALNTTHDLNYDYSTFHTGGLITLNYLFPLAYPEIAIPHLIYTKRLAVNLFSEKFWSNTQNMTWSGVDIFLTARYFNTFDFTAGLRVSYRWKQDSEPFSWSMVFLHDL